MRKMLFKLSGVVASLALVVTAMNVNAVCIWIIHQPKMPEGAKQLRKF